MLHNCYDLTQRRDNGRSGWTGRLTRLSMIYREVRNSDVTLSLQLGASVLYANPVFILMPGLLCSVESERWRGGGEGAGEVNCMCSHEGVYAELGQTQPPNHARSD